MSSFEFLTEPPGAAVAPQPDGAPGARAPARGSELRDGWNVAVTTTPASARAASAPVAWADVSHLGKLEVRAGPDLEPRHRARARDDGAWWCPSRASARS